MRVQGGVVVAETELRYRVGANKTSASIYRPGEPVGESLVSMPLRIRAEGSFLRLEICGCRRFQAPLQPLAIPARWSNRVYV